MIVKRLLFYFRLGIIIKLSLREQAKRIEREKESAEKANPTKGRTRAEATRGSGGDGH